MVRTAAALVRATHAAPTAMVTLLSAGLLASLGGTLARSALATAAVLSGQLSVGWSNDWIDAARDVAVGRRDKPVVAGDVTASMLRTCALVAAASCTVLSLATGLLPGTVHLAAVASAWTYNAGLKRTVWSWAPYALSFALLPVFLARVAGVAGVPWRLAAAGALLGVGAHLANALPDLEDDAATGVVGLPHRLGRRGSAALAPVVLVAAAALAAAAGGPARLAGALGAGVLALAAGVAGVLRPTSRLPFALSMAVAAVCVLLLATAGPGAV